MRAPWTLLFAGLLWAAIGCAHSSAAVTGCSTPGPAARSAAPGPLTLHLDYLGAEALIDALERDSLSDADVDTLLRIRGVRAVVDNVTRFIPRLGVPQFRAEVRNFARTKKAGASPEFQLADAWRARAQTRGLVNALHAGESGIVSETVSLLERYGPDSLPMTIGVYFVAGGVSDGFVFESDPAFYINLTRAGGDCRAVAGNIAHEAYHVVQTAAQKRAGRVTAWISDERMSLIDRLLAGTLLEGTATLVADPSHLASGAGVSPIARDLYARNSEPVRIAENFAVFDTVAQRLRDGTMAWGEVSMRGFLNSPGNEERFYFVGYEMAQAIERYCGTRCIGALFAKPPIEFFREYIRLYREHPDIRWRFNPATEGYLASIQ